MSEEVFKLGSIVVIALIVCVSAGGIVKTYTEHDMAKLKFMAEYEKRCKR